MKEDDEEDNAASFFVIAAAAQQQYHCHSKNKKEKQSTSETGWNGFVMSQNLRKKAQPHLFSSTECHTCLSVASS